MKENFGDKTVDVFIVKIFVILYCVSVIQKNIGGSKLVLKFNLLIINL